MQDPDSGRAELEADASLLGEPRRRNVPEIGGWMSYDDDERKEGRKERMAGARGTRRKLSRRVLSTYKILPDWRYRDAEAAAEIFFHEI